MKSVKPRSSNPLSRTVRALGRPRASAVANTIAFGSGSADPASAASADACSYQRANWATQLGARSDSYSLPAL